MFEEKLEAFLAENDARPVAERCAVLRKLVSTIPLLLISDPIRRRTENMDDQSLFLEAMRLMGPPAGWDELYDAVTIPEGLIASGEEYAEQVSARCKAKEDSRREELQRQFPDWTN